MREQVWSRMIATALRSVTQSNSRFHRLDGEKPSERRQNEIIRSCGWSQLHLSPRRFPVLGISTFTFESFLNFSRKWFNSARYSWVLTINLRFKALSHPAVSRERRNDETFVHSILNLKTHRLWPVTSQSLTSLDSREMLRSMTVSTRRGKCENYLLSWNIRAHIASKQIRPRYAIRYVLQHLHTADQNEALSVS